MNTADGHEIKINGQYYYTDGWSLIKCTAVAQNIIRIDGKKQTINDRRQIYISIDLAKNKIIRKLKREKRLIENKIRSCIENLEKEKLMIDLQIRKIKEK